MSVEELGTSPRRHWPPYALTALMLVLVILIFRLADIKKPTGTQRIESETQSILTGDWSVKGYLAQRYLPKMFGSASSPSVAQRELADALRRAEAKYRTAAGVKNPTPSAIRRLAVISAVNRRSDTLKIVSKLDSKAVTKDRPAADVRDLKSEKRMWAAIFSRSVKPDDVPRYAARISKLRMGPVQGFALSELYTAAGDPARAQRTIEEASRQAASTTIPMLLLFGLGVLAAVAGVLFIVVFTVYAIVERDKVFPRSNVDASEPVADAMFKGFSAYMGIAFLLQLGIGLAAAPYAKNLPSEQRFVVSALFMAVVGGLTDLSALAVFYVVMKRAGSSLAAVGLTKKNFGINVLWGMAGYCALLPTLILTSLIWSKLSKTLFRGIETPDNPVTQLFTSENAFIMALAVIAASIFAPFFEELFFRGALYHGLRTRLGIAVSILITGAVFAMLHPLPGGFLPILAMATIFALLTESRQSLVPAMVTHALNNTMIAVFLFLLTN